jgi:glutamate formiminotransferase/formiminotetrahydrofolate cyclodeaminase
VKALGLLVDDRAQVSMNLTNYHATPIHRVVEYIRREAERYGVGIQHSELVGLIPEEALVDAAIWYTQLDQFETDQILERRLAAAGEGAAAEAVSPVLDGSRFLEALASDSPVPGGGSASAYSGAAGAALVAMVANLTIGKKKYAPVEEQMVAILEEATSLRKYLSAAVEHDAAVFEGVMEAYRLPKTTSNEKQVRAAAIERALLKAARVPLDVAHKSVRVMELAVQVIAQGNVNAISDGATAAAQARAALLGAGYNVRINVASLNDKDRSHSMLDELSQLETQAANIEDKIRSELRERGGMPLA